MLAKVFKLNVTQMKLKGVLQTLKKYLKMLIKIESHMQNIRGSCTFIMQYAGHQTASASEIKFIALFTEGY